MDKKKRDTLFHRHAVVVWSDCNFDPCFYILPHHVLPCVITGAYTMTYAANPPFSHLFIHSIGLLLRIRFVRSLVPCFSTAWLFRLLFTPASLTERRFVRVASSSFEQEKTCDAMWWLVARSWDVMRCGSMWLCQVVKSGIMCNELWRTHFTTKPSLPPARHRNATSLNQSTSKNLVALVALCTIV